MIRALLRLTALGACALALSGCVSLLPKSKPAQLYRFTSPPAEAPASTAASVGVFLANGSFQRESAGDRMLTITGERAAYVAQARWVAPAQVLFDQAVQSAFETRSQKVRLVARGELVHTDYVLRIDVRNFEAHYDQGPKAAPQILVRARVSLIRGDNRNLVADQTIEATARAGDNRVGPIVEAYDHAVGEVLDKMVAWTNQQAG